MPVLFDKIDHYRLVEINKDATSFAIDIHGIARKSLKGVLLLFEDAFEEGKRDSELFANPAITDISFTIDELPNKHYSSGFKNYYQWREISKLFLQEDSKQIQNSNMNLLTYYTHHKFALWVDLRSTEDNSLHGSGKEQAADKIINMFVTKNKHGTGKYVMHIYTISDARVIIKNKRLDKFEY